MEFNQTPKYVMYYLFPVDSILRHKKTTLKTLDKSTLCLPQHNDEQTSRMLPLFHPISPDEIVKDLREMNLTGVACVGVDGTCLSVEEIKSRRYADLIKKCRKAGLLFIHGFPFADTYHNESTQSHPQIKQGTFNGGHPTVGWDAKNAHFNIDYGSDEFIDFCRKSIDALKELGCEVIDYAEPDHFPWADNGYGESLVKDYQKETGEEPPHPTNLKHRRFLEERNLRGVNAIGDYARSKGMADHLTASPLIHCSPLICQNFGKYSRTKVDQLSTTFHDSFGFGVAGMMNDQLNMSVSPIRTHAVGCIESRSMRGWNERHAVYIGCGGGYPLEQFEESLPATVILHQMDLFFWDYTNFKNTSMYPFNKFEHSKIKYSKFKKLVRNTIAAYMSLPKDYRESIPEPDALVLYAKESDYVSELNKEYRKDDLNGAYSLYASALNLQMSDVPFMVAFDEYPEVLAKDGQDTPLVIIDGYQNISGEFADAVEAWFAPKKAVVFSGILEGKSKALIETLAGNIGMPKDVKLAEISMHRNSDYAKAAPSINLDGWAELIRINSRPMVWVKGSAQEGLLAYSSTPFSRLYKYDVQAICHTALAMLGRRPEIIEGTMPREVVRYRKNNKKYLVIKNHGGLTESITIKTQNKPIAFHLRQGDTCLAKQNDGSYTLELNFKPKGIRIIEYGGGLKGQCKCMRTCKQVLQRGGQEKKNRL